MLTIYGNDIHLTRGDTAYIFVPITFTDGSAYTMQDGDKLEFSAKKYISADAYIIHKEISSDGVFKLEPSDTASLDYGKYVYDVQLTKANGDVHTVITPSRFYVEEEVTV